MTTAGATARPGLARSVLALLLGLVAVAAYAEASTTLDFVTFDGVAYIRWQDEPGRSLTPDDLGIEFGTVQCSLGEDVRGCPRTASTAAPPSCRPARGMHVVRGHPTEFRLAAVWRDPVFLYPGLAQSASEGGQAISTRLAGKVRVIDVRRGAPAPGGTECGRRSPARAMSRGWST